jgi:hypothetical protein
MKEEEEEEEEAREQSGCIIFVHRQHERREDMIG